MSFFCCVFSSPFFGGTYRNGKMHMHFEHSVLKNIFSHAVKRIKKNVKMVISAYVCSVHVFLFFSCLIEITFSHSYLSGL